MVVISSGPDLIKYLVARKFPHARDAFSPRVRFEILPKPTADAGTLRILADKYEHELSQLSPEQITELVTVEREQEAGELVKIEAKQWFNQPECNADFDYWCKTSFWTTAEAITLTLGKDPKKVSWEAVKSEAEYSPFVREFEKRLEIGERAQTMGFVVRLNPPFRFLLWAKQIDLSYPQELEPVVTRFNSLKVNWQEKHEEEQRAHTATREELAKARREIEELSKDHLSLKERESLLKIVIGLAMEDRGYNPEQVRSPIPREIAEVLAAQNIPLHEDTVRKFLREAGDLLPRSG